MTFVENYKCTQIQSFDSSIDTTKLVIFGKPGTGKTYALRHVASLYQKNDCIFVKVADYVDDMRINLNSKGGDRYVFSKYRNRPVVILDDLGVESLSEKSVEYIYKFLDERQKKTIISTNLSLEEIQNRYGARIFSRLAGNYKFIEFEGDDWRLKNFEIEKARFDETL